MLKDTSATSGVPRPQPPRSTIRFRCSCETAGARSCCDNTLVLFTGDNGYLLGRHGLWSKGLASDPINMYEEVMRVPIIWSWPGKIPTDAMAPELVSFYDVLPTLCEAAGVTAARRTQSDRAQLPLPIAKRDPLPKKQPMAQSGVRPLPEHGDGARQRLQAGAPQ